MSLAHFSNQNRSLARVARSTRQTLLNAFLCLLPFALCGAVSAQPVTVQFTQTGFEGGGAIRGVIHGEDKDDDGKLYLMSGYIANAFGIPEGDEVTYISITMENLNGRTFTQVWDASKAGIDDPTSSFFGLSYNLDGGPLGDQPDEGISFGPFSPSTSYVAGELFHGAINPFPLPDVTLTTCGNPVVGACGAVITLVPGEVFPEAFLTYSNLSSSPIQVTEELTYEFRQGGFPGGGSVHGILAGRDLDGDGRLYSMASFIGDFLGQPAGDEVTFASVTFENIDQRTWTQVWDASVTGIQDPPSSFYGFAYNLDGGELGDEPDEGISFAPFAPSTSYVQGELFGPAISPDPIPDVVLVTCGQPEVGPCGTVVSLVPGEPFPAVDVTFATHSAEATRIAPKPMLLDATYSAQWYDPERNGEGFSLQFLPDGRVAVLWFTYTDEGGQRWFTGIGRIEGKTLLVDELFETSGGSFGPDFDPAAVSLTPAGTMKFEFIGCNAGTVEYDVDGIQGKHDLVRLLNMRSIECNGP